MHDTETIANAVHGIRHGAPGLYTTAGCPLLRIALPTKFTNNNSEAIRA